MSSTFYILLAVTVLVLVVFGGFVRKMLKKAGVDDDLVDEHFEKLTEIVTQAYVDATKMKQDGNLSNDEIDKLFVDAVMNTSKKYGIPEFKVKLFMDTFSVLRDELKK